MATPAKKSFPIGQILLLLVLAGVLAWRFWPKRTEVPEVRYRCDSCGAVVFRQPTPELPHLEIPPDAGPEEVKRIMEEEFIAQHSAGLCSQCGAGTLREGPFFKCTTCDQVFEGTIAVLRQDTKRCPKCGKMMIEQLPWNTEPPANAILVDPTKGRKRT